jgi:hypothetical protein
MSPRRTAAVAVAVLVAAGLPAGAQTPCPVSAGVCSRAWLTDAPAGSYWNVEVTFSRTGYLWVSSSTVATPPGVPGLKGSLDMNYASNVFDAGRTIMLDPWLMGGWTEGATYVFPVSGWFVPEGDTRTAADLRALGFLGAAFPREHGLVGAGQGAVVVYTTTSVPEPATWTMLAGGLVAVLGTARQRRRPTR